MVPFLDLKKINLRYQAELISATSGFLDEGQYILGSAVSQFENEFAAYCKTKYCVGVGNGLDALRLILEGYKILGKLKTGDKVLVAANSYIATILAIKQAGMIPVFVETEGRLFNFDVEKLKQIQLDGVKAVFVTHLYGQLGPVEDLKAFAKANDLLLIEDAAQAHGARFSTENTENSIKTTDFLAGCLGHAAAFSLYPTKNLGALGDAGAITTNDKELADIVKQLRNYGSSTRYINDHLGLNSRLDELQAAFLSIKLKTLDADNEKRRIIATRYLTEITNEQIKLPFYAGDESHVFHLFVVQVENRARFIEHLNEFKIGSLIHYPVPPYKQKALAEYNHLKFPVTERLADEVLSIPISPVMSHEEVTQVIDCINAYHV